MAFILGKPNPLTYPIPQDYRGGPLGRGIITNPPTQPTRVVTSCRGSVDMKAHGQRQWLESSEVYILYTMTGLTYYYMHLLSNTRWSQI